MGHCYVATEDLRLAGRVDGKKIKAYDPFMLYKPPRLVDRNEDEPGREGYVHWEVILNVIGMKSEFLGFFFCSPSYTQLIEVTDL